MVNYKVASIKHRWTGRKFNTSNSLPSLFTVETNKIKKVCFGLNKEIVKYKDDSV